jgi:hypothetical protein
MSSTAPLIRAYRDHPFRGHRDFHSELARFIDRHQLGTDNRDHFGTMIFISSERLFSWLGVRKVASRVLTQGLSPQPEGEGSMDRRI